MFQVDLNTKHVPFIQSLLWINAKMKPNRQSIALVKPSGLFYWFAFNLNGLGFDRLRLIKINQIKGKYRPINFKMHDILQSIERKPFTRKLTKFNAGESRF